jgi:transketolase C-terminal domain/subunit
LTVDVGDGEEFETLYARTQKALAASGPVAVVNQRPMAPGVPGIEGSNAGHEVIGKDDAIAYLHDRGHDQATQYINDLKVEKSTVALRGSSEEVASNRTEFGKIVSSILDEMGEDERTARVLVIDSDLEGSTGLKGIRQTHPEVCINGGVQERGNFSAAAGFGFESGKQGVFGTFSAFLEMIVSEATMARLNGANVICHFSHAGVDEIADNTCHFGVNIFLAHSGLPEDDQTRLYFAADARQLEALVRRIWNDEGLRYVFSTRSKVPYILKEDGNYLYGDGYTFVPGRDEGVREGSAGYVVSYGEMLYRALDAVERARAEGIDVGLVNKPTLNVADDDMLTAIGQTGFVLVVEGQNANTGLGSRFGTWLLERGLTPRFATMATTRPGNGGIAEQVPYQGLAPDDILAAVTELAREGA